MRVLDNASASETAAKSVGDNSVRQGRSNGVVGRFILQPDSDPPSFSGTDIAIATIWVTAFILIVAVPPMAAGFTPALRFVAVN